MYNRSAWHTGGLICNQLRNFKKIIMKKRFLYFSILFLFAIVSGFIILKYKKDKSMQESELFEIIPRKGNSMQLPEWALSKKMSAGLIQKIKENPSDIKSLVGLAAIYLQEARSSGNFAYYDKAALNCIHAILKKDANNFEALTFRAMIYLSQHHFTEGLKAATQVEKTYSYNAFVYGILVDANVELGNYQAALDDADKMVSIRPDIRSYSRISYLREIYGDIPGAIEAMKLAVDAGAPGTESTEWARVQLGKLYEQIGEMKYAEMHYTIALNNRPGYPYALAGLARIAINRKDYQKAIELDGSKYGWIYELGLICYSNNNNLDALKYIQLAGEKGYPKDNGYLQNLGIANIDAGKFDAGISILNDLLKKRPGDLNLLDMVAQSYYENGKYDEAMNNWDVMLGYDKTNASALYMIGMCYQKKGDKAKGTQLCDKAIEMDPSLAMYKQKREMGGF